MLLFLAWLVFDGCFLVSEDLSMLILHTGQGVPKASVLGTAWG